MRVIRTVASCCVVVASAALAAQSSAVDAEFTAGSVAVDGREYSFRRLAPLPEWRLGPQPLVVFLHGAGERGTDNQQQLAWLPRELAQPDNRRRFPCHLLAVQCPPGEAWTAFVGDHLEPTPLGEAAAPALRAVMAAMDRILGEPGVDGGRVYLTGLSMGGFGAFELATRMPQRFASLLPVCGGGEPFAVERLLGLPTLVYHGAEDTVVPPARSRAMVSALRAIGAPVDYREIAGVGHDVWKNAYRPDTGLAWLFAQDQRQQQRGEYAVPPVIPEVDTAVRLPGTFELAAGARCICPRSLQAAAQTLLEAIEPDAALRPALVGEAEVRAGDIVFTVDAAAGPVYELDVGEALRVVVHDEREARRAAAAAWQALKTLPGHRCPRGRYVRKEPRLGGAVVLDGDARQWPATVLTAAIRECWNGGADRLCGAGLDGLTWLDDGERARVRASAERSGVRLDGDEPTPPDRFAVFRTVAAADGARDLAGLLGAPMPPEVMSRPFLLHVGGATVESLVPVLRTHLPAAAERADRGGRTVHVGALLGRLGQLLQPSGRQR